MTLKANGALGEGGLLLCSGDMLLTERYCVVFQTLATPPQLSATIA